ncbi:MAG: hypothetical protein A4E49_03085 [Methanosaeta sp. PtaU1.Bin112]|nr:MAG: hypothetical protein A4E49_03085 [Methanosaeta sp. PtaU1.Bin112]
MKTLLAALVLVVCLICLMASDCYADDTGRFQSVGGDYGRKLISTIKSSDAEPAAASGTNGSLWSWGSSPKGSLVIDGNLVGDPAYTMKKLNVVKNWLGDTFVDPYGTASPAYTYTDPVTGESIPTYVDPTSGQSYYTYVDYKSGKTVYVYFNPDTGVPIYASYAPLSGQSAEQKQSTSTLPPIFS